MQADRRRRHAAPESVDVSDKGTPTGRAAKRRADSPCLTGEVSSGWYESILTEGPLPVTTSAVDGSAATATASSDFKEDPIPTASPASRPSGNAGLVHCPSRCVAGEVWRLHTSSTRPILLTNRTGRASHMCRSATVTEPAIGGVLRRSAGRESSAARLRKQCRLRRVREQRLSARTKRIAIVVQLGETSPSENSPGLHAPVEHSVDRSRTCDGAVPANVLSSADQWFGMV
jgi:hypothetical protein